MRVACGGNRRLTGAHCPSSKMHSACSALPDSAPIFGAAQIQDIAQNPQQRHVLRNIHGERLSVYDKFVGHNTIQDGKGFEKHADLTARKGNSKPKDRTAQTRCQLGIPETTI
jgi:hypothetical protein